MSDDNTTPGAANAPINNPTPAEAPVAPAPAAAPVAPAPAKKSNKGLIIGLCSVLGLGIIGAVIAIIVINNNKPKPEDELNNLLNSLFTGYNDDEEDDDDDYDYTPSWLTDDDEEEEDEEEEEEEDEEEEDETPVTTNVDSCSDAFDCVAKINGVMTVAEINKMTGITGEQSAYSDTRYTWTFPNGEELEASTSYFDVSVDYKAAEHKDSSIDLSGYNNIKDRIKSGVTYDEFVSALNGAKGTVYKKGEYSTGYLWVDGKGGYLYVTVSNTTGQISFVGGMLY